MNFNLKSDNLHFSKVEQIQNDKKEFLYLHNPKWSDSDFRLKFINTFYRVYQTIYNKEKIIYVSLQQVRDEVCRLLRINAELFDRFLELSYSESVNKKMPYIIALETDVREDQKSGSQIQRRGVYVKNILHSLIAINN